MDVKEINHLFLQGKLNEEGLFPQLNALKNLPVSFAAEFGLPSLPKEPGLILIRGARQMGKSTWLEKQMKLTIENEGGGSVIYLNGDTILDSTKLIEEIRFYLSLLPRSVALPKIFIDEITTVPDWERALKILYDSGETRKVLIVTTGSKAIDLRRGTERLPGRKGRLDRTNYIFTPISFKQFKNKCTDIFQSDLLLAYLITGGSPIAINELIRCQRIPDYVLELTRDWILGECAMQDRSRNLLVWIIHALIERGGTPVPLTKLAQEAGIANNTVAKGYIDLLGDLLCLSTAMQVDSSTLTPIPKKAHKYPWTNLLAAFSFHPAKPRTIQDFKNFPPQEQGRWFEWLVAQELWRKSAIAGNDQPEIQYFWQSDSNEVDFLEGTRTWIEVKRGSFSPLEFAWFPKVFPKSQLKVIYSSIGNDIGRRQTPSFLEAIPLDDFLSSD